MTTSINSRSGEKGFTLVELSIVMIIIGLLIGGVLKGQELIANARITAAVSEIKAIDAAINTFRDSYGGLPGDITAPQNRLANCTNRCNNAGNANGQIGAAPDAANGATSENIVAWAQLANADLISGVRDMPAADVIGAGTTNPSAEVPGQIYIGYAANVPALTFETSTVTGRAGHYLAVYNGAGAVAQAAAAAGTMSLTPSQANRIDLKLDDGLPNTGTVVASGVAGAAGCSAGANDTAANNLYNGGLTGLLCGVYVRIQQ